MGGSGVCNVDRAAPWARTVSDVNEDRFFRSADLMTAEPARDFVGYGERPPRVHWPGGARVAVQIVVNYEEGSEKSFAMGDGVNDSLYELGHTLEDQRDLAFESTYEYGSRAGIWRLFRMFDQAGVLVTFFANAVALLRNPAVTEKAVRRGDEIAAHGYRWIGHWEMTESVEREVIRRSVSEIESATGIRPVGWYSRKMGVNTRRLVVEHGGFLYDSESYDDDLPHWTLVGDKPHLVVPYTLVINDARFVTGVGYSSPEDLFAHAKASLDRLCDDGDDVSRMMSIGLHARITGQPSRADALSRFIDYAQGRGDVWFARRAEIATTFAAQYPADRALGLPAPPRTSR